MHIDYEIIKSRVSRLELPEHVLYFQEQIRKQPALKQEMDTLRGELESRKKRVQAGELPERAVQAIDEQITAIIRSLNTDYRAKILNSVTGEIGQMLSDLRLAVDVIQRYINFGDGIYRDCKEAFEALEARHRAMQSAESPYDFGKAGKRKSESERETTAIFAVRFELEEIAKKRRATLKAYEDWLIHGKKLV